MMPRSPSLIRPGRSITRVRRHWRGTCTGPSSAISSLLPPLGLFRLVLVVSVLTVAKCGGHPSITYGETEPTTFGENHLRESFSPPRPILRRPAIQTSLLLHHAAAFAGIQFGERKSRKLRSPLFVRTLLRITNALIGKKKDCCGFDILFVHRLSRDELHVEVKGTAGLRPHFFISDNEYAYAEKSEEWRLAMVTNALDDPAVEILTYPQAKERFDWMPFAWHATERITSG